MTWQEAANKRWSKIREDIAAEHAVLIAEGRVVCSSRVHFPAGHKLAYHTVTLADFSLDQLAAEMVKRGGPSPPSPRPSRFRLFFNWMCGIIRQCKK